LAFAANELGSVPLIATQSYDPRKEENRGMNQFISTVGGALAGIFVGDVSAKIETEALAKLSTPEMAKYFPNASERSQIAKRIAGEAKRRYLANGTSNEVLISAAQFAANEVIRTVMNRVMETEGARDAARREQWIQKILDPINSCIKASNAYTEAAKCLEASEKDLGPNLGQAIGYELINQELGPEQAKAFPAQYVKCLQPQKAGADKRMMGCVLDNVRKTIAAYGKGKALLVAKKEVPSAATKIVAKTGLAFEACLSTASIKTDFRDCADQFSIATGSEIAAAAVRLNPQVLKQIEGNYLDALTERTKSNFATCMQNNLSQNKRDQTGGLETANCANLVRYDAAKVVAYELFRENIAANMDGAEVEKKKIGTNIYKLLDTCWNSNAGEAVNNACLRKTVQQLVTTIADPQLSKELPPALIAKSPKFKDSLLSQLRECLESRLPTNMMAAEDTNERVAGCTGKLTRDAGLKVAEFQFRDVLFGRTRDTALVDQLVEKIIKGNFATCLGPAPMKDALDQCSIKLRIEAGQAVANVLVPNEFDRFVDNHGGKQAYKLTDAKRQEMLAPVLSAHTICLNNGGKAPNNAAAADAIVNACFKNTIKLLSGKLGRMEFLRSVASYTSGDQKAWAKTGDDLAQDLRACLSEKDAPEIALREYLAQIDICRVRLTTSYTEKVAQAQLRDAIQKNIPSSTPEQIAKQKKMEAALMDPFLDCVGDVEAEDANGLDNCAKNLQREATQSIAIDAGRQRAMAVLATDKLPQEIIHLEVKFNACITGKSVADDCAKDYARSLAKFLAGIKMRQSLADVLGKDRYLATLPAAEAAEKDFTVCVDAKYVAPLDDKFLGSLDKCSKKLEERIVGFIQTQFVDEMESSKQGAEAQVNHDLAVAIPCLGDLMPGTPIESAIVNLDPESFLVDFAKMIGDFINYDVEKAGMDYQVVLSQLLKDMEAAGPVAAREKLLKLLIDRGMVDRLLKSMVRSRILENLKALPAEDRLTPELEKTLSDRATVEKALTPEIMAELRPMITEKILKPMLLEGKGMSDPKVSAAMNMLEAKVMGSLIDSPHFGDLIIKDKIQQNIDQSTNMFTRFAGRLFAGYQTFTWSEAREKPAGKEAEAFLRDQIIHPRLSGQQIPDYKARMDKVSAMVKEALKKP
jgi:hypothetical protein